MNSGSNSSHGAGAEPPLRVLVLGATGMLGNALVRVFGPDGRFAVSAASRSHDAARHFPQLPHIRFLGGLDAENPDSLARIVAAAEPQVVINAIGVVKQLGDAKSVLASVPINTLLPHRLVSLAAIGGARVVHVSTDCVFSGATGNYTEGDPADATDVYGLSKYLGEVAADNAITLRTSIIGHELRGRLSLLEWFLAQTGRVKGFKHAIFSGLPTGELARVIRDEVIPRPELSGLYHVSAAPIAKFDLLNLIARAYGKDVVIEPESEFRIDRSLDSARFRAATGYLPPSWPELVAAMRDLG